MKVAVMGAGAVANAVRWIGCSAISIAALLAAGTLSSCTHTPGREKGLDPVMAVAVSSDGRTIGASTTAFKLEVALFDAAPLRFRSLLTPDMPEPPRKISIQFGAAATPPSPPVTPGIFQSPPLAFSPDGDLLVGAGVRRELVGWDVDSGSVRFPVPVEPEMVDLAFFPDGRSFLTVGQALKRWRADDASPLGEFKPPDAANVTAVAVSPDGRVVLAGLSNGKIAEFDAQTGRVLRTLAAHAVAVTGIAVAPDGSTFASTAGLLDPRLWNWGADSPLPGGLWEWKGVSESLKSASDSLSNLTGPWKPWNLREAKNFSSKLCRPRVAYSPDGRYLAATAQLSLRPSEFQILIVDLARERGRVLYGQFFGCGVAFTRDSKFVVTGGFGAPDVWNVETGERVPGAD